MTSQDTFTLNSLQFTRKTANDTIFISLEPLVSKAESTSAYIWKEKYDPKSKRQYYINLKTKKSQWHLPKRSDFSKEELGILDAYVVRRKVEEGSLMEKTGGVEASSTATPSTPTANPLGEKAKPDESSTELTNSAEQSTQPQSPSHAQPQSSTPATSTLSNTDPVMLPILEHIQSNQHEIVQIGFLKYHKVTLQSPKTKVFFLEQGRSTPEFLYQEIFSKQHNRSYFKQMSTKKTSWKLPKGVAPADSASPITPVIMSEHIEDRNTVASPTVVSSDPKTEPQPIVTEKTSVKPDSVLSAPTLSATTAPVNNTEIHDGIIFVRTDTPKGTFLVVQGQSAPEYFFKVKDDPKSKRAYFVSMSTKKSMWKLPARSAFDLSKIQEALVENQKEEKASVSAVGEASAFDASPTISTPTPSVAVESQRKADEPRIVLQQIDTSIPAKSADLSSPATPRTPTITIPPTPTDTPQTPSTPQASTSTEFTHNGVTFQRTEDSPGVIMLKVKGTSDKKYMYRQKLDPKTQRHYYINQETRKSSWKLPQFSAEEMAQFQSNIEATPVVEVSATPVTDESVGTPMTPISTPATPTFSQVQQHGADSTQSPTSESVTSATTPMTPISTPATPDSPRFNDTRTLPAPITVPTHADDSNTDTDHSPASLNPSPTNKRHAAHLMNIGRRSSFRMSPSPLSGGSPQSEQLSPATFDHSRTFSGDRKKNEKDVTSHSRSTLTRDNGFSGEAVRGALEDTIDNAIFFRIGAGETRTLVAVEAFLYDDTIQTTQKRKPASNKQSIVVCVARDFCGVYGLFFLDKRVTKAKSTMTSSYILQSFPLVDMVTVREMDEAGANSKFQLNINDTQCTLLTETELKNRLVNCISFAVRSYPSFDNVSKCILRMAAVDFVRTFHTPAPPAEHTIGTGDLVRSLIALRDNKRLETLRILIRDTTHWDTAMESLINFMCSSDFSVLSARSCFLILRDLMRIVAPSKKPHLRDKIIPMLSRLLKRDVPQLRQFDISGMIQQLNFMFNAQEDWVSRGHLPDVDFTADFYSESNNTKTKFEKARAKRRTKIANVNLPSGVYMAVLVHTPDNNRVLASTKGNGLPMFEVPLVQYHAAVQQTVEDSDDMAWLCSLGEFNKSLVNRLAVWAKNSPNISVFLRGFIQCMYDIVNQSKFLDNLGYLLDYPVQMMGSEQRSAVLVFATTVQDEQVFPAPKEYQWRDSLGFEHAIYQKLYDIDETSRLEKLSHQYNGERWIHSAIVHEECMRERVRPGFYVAHLRMYEEPGDLSVLITDKNRMLIPHQFVQDKIPAPHEWMELTNLIAETDLSDDFLRGETFIPHQGTRHHECQSLKQRFFRAWHVLAQDLDVDSLGELYSMEMIPLDDGGKIHFCVFYHSVMDRDEKNLISQNRKFLWRRKSALANMYNQVYNTSAYSLRLESILNQMTKRKELSNMGTTAVDEALRNQTENNDVPLQICLDKWWMSFLWMDLVVYCSNLEVQTVYVHQDAAAKLYEYVKHLHKQRIVILHLVSEGKKWDQIVEHLKLEEESNIETLNTKYPVEPYVDPVPEVEDWDNIFPEEIETDRNLDEIIHLDELLSGPTAQEVCQFLVDDIIDDSMVLYFDRQEMLECAEVVESMLDHLESIEEAEEDALFAQIIEQSQELVARERQRYKEQIVDMFHTVTHDAKTDKELSQMELTYERLVGQMVTCFQNTVQQGEALFQVIYGAQNTLELEEQMASYEIALDNYDFFTECSVDGEILTKEELKAMGVPPKMARTLLQRLPPPHEVVDVKKSPDAIRAAIYEELQRTGTYYQMVSNEEVEAERRRMEIQIQMQEASLRRVGKQYQDNFPKYQRGSKLVRF